MQEHNTHFTITKINKPDLQEVQIVEPQAQVSCAKIPEISIDEIQQLHKLLDSLIEISKSQGWDIETLADLLIKNVHEANILKQFRILQKLRSETTTKSIIDTLISNSNELFENRNNGKKKNKDKHKSWFTKKSKS